MYSAYLHDAILLYAHGLNKTLSQGGNYTDGRAITQNMFGMEFLGK
jgi:hypothetical protein